MDKITIKPLKSSTPLSKSRFVNGMKCPILAFLEVRTDVPAAELNAIDQSRFETGDAVGELARKRYDQKLGASGLAPGILISEDPREHEKSVAKTAEALSAGTKVIYEAAFNFGGIKVRVDILERLEDGSFAINEVKSTTKFNKNKHELDVAVQLYVLKGNNLDISQVNLVLLNKDYIWPGGDYDLEQLFTETNVTDLAEEEQSEIPLRVEQLLKVVKTDEFPNVSESVSCTKPYECPYMEACPVERVVIVHPISELPSCRIGQGAHKRLVSAGFDSLLDIDKETALREMVTSSQLNEKWYNTWKATVEDSLIILDDGKIWLETLNYPIYHLDFETINPALPVIISSHPFEQIPLQYSIHIENEDGTIQHREFLVKAEDPNPRKALLEQLIIDLGKSGTILEYSSFETQRIKRLAELYPDKVHEIGKILDRMKDLGSFVSKYVFHKDFHGKWSIKKVHPVLVSGNTAEITSDGQAANYEDLDGISKGDEASLALVEYLALQTTEERREEISKQLLEYCELDTRAMVEVLRAIKTASPSKAES